MGLGRGYADSTDAEDANLLPGASGIGLGQGTLHAFGIGTHQAARAELGAPVPPDADGDEVRGLGAFQHRQHGPTGGARGFAIVIGAEG